MSSGPVVLYSRDDFMEMTSGNKVSRKCGLFGSQRIELKGKTIVHDKVVIRGDLATVKVGRFCHIGAGSILHPPCKELKGAVLCIPLLIGDFTTIGDNCTISATSVGSCVSIGAGSVISKRCILKDCCVILPGTVLAPDTVVPPYTVFGGKPGRMVDELNETHAERQRQAAMDEYNNFQPKSS